MQNNLVSGKKVSHPVVPSMLDAGWFDKFFNMPVDEFFSSKMTSVPAVNISENEIEFLLTLGVPGLRKEDFKIEVADGLLTIMAEKSKEEKIGNHHYNRREYNYSAWSRSFAMPENCFTDKIRAEFKNGELIVIVPKSEDSVSENVKKIAIT
jgi:HSP20 family protein